MVDIAVVDEASSLLTIISIREECTLAELRKDMNDEAPNLLPSTSVSCTIESVY